ncbi:MAG TPA: glucose 1-dehydrogenase [Polyangiaceae bacterium]|nr:glucose 1-dehydrogenase [Polyangiaceae bacterium]
MGKLSNKVVVVTGASKGIGAGIAKRAAAEGARVVVNYAASRSDAERVVAEIEAKGGKAIALQADVAKLADVQRLFAETKRVFEKVDVLVNNAGVYKFAPLEQVEEAEFNRQFQTNVLGPLLVTQESLKHFGPEGGSVINISSVVSELAPPGSSIYSASKGALDAITRVLSKELSNRKIRVNTIAPGGVETEGLHAQGIVGSDMMNAVVAQTPLGRLGQPDDIARVAVFLASDDSGWLTGERLNASGGFH